MNFSQFCCCSGRSNDKKLYCFFCFVGVLVNRKIDCVAALTQGLHVVHNVGVRMVDDVCEEIRLGLEEEDFTQDQRRLAYVKFLGELYTYQVIGSQVVFDTLYLFITYGLTDDESEFYLQNQNQGQAGDEKNSDNNNSESNNKPNPNWLSRSDIHWKYCFRAQLCCELLQTCGVYLRSGKLRSRCDRFLLYFQRFIILHSPLPLDIQWWVDDVMEYVAPDIEKHTALESVLNAITVLERKELESDKVHRDALVAISDENKEDDNEDDDLDDIDDDDEEEDDDDEEEDEDDIDETSARILEDEDDTAVLSVCVCSSLLAIPVRLLSFVKEIDVNTSVGAIFKQILN